MLVAVEEGAVDARRPGRRAARARRDAAAPARPRVRAARRSGGCGRSRRPTRRVYSNVGIELAGRARRGGASSMPFADYFDEAVVDPLGLTGDEPGRARRPRDGVSIGRRPRPGRAGSCLSPHGLLHRVDARRRRRSVQYPGLRGVLPGFGAQDPNDWGLGFEIRGHKSAALDRCGQLARDVRPLRAERHDVLGGPGSRNRSGRARRPRLRAVGRAGLAARCPTPSSPPSDLPAFAGVSSRVRLRRGCVG